MGAGMMPMGGMGAGGSRSDDQDRKSASYLTGDRSVFEPDDSAHEMLLGHLAADDEPPRRRR